MGPLMPGLLNDYFFKSELMIGTSMAITIGFAAIMTAVMFRVLYVPYRRHSLTMEELVTRIA